MDILTISMAAKISRIMIVATSCLLLINCTSSSFIIEEMPSKNQSQRVKFLIIDNTAKNYQDSVKALVNKGSVSSHYLLPQNHDESYHEPVLKAHQLINEAAQAWHVGGSYWQGRAGINEQAISISMINMPRCEGLPVDETHFTTKANTGGEQMCFYPDYDPKQITLLIELAKKILTINPDISPTHILGQSDVTPQSKNNPSSRFPWYQLYQEGIGAWYETDTAVKFWQIFNQQMPTIALVQRALNIYGYAIKETGELDEQTQAVLHAFQRHFSPWNITGRVNDQTVATLFALLEKYMPEPTKKLLARYQKELASNSSVQPFIVKHGQIDHIYPEQNPSNRERVNNRAMFKGYEGRGEIIINNKDADSADIYINGEKLNITKLMHGYNTYQYSLAKRTKNGDNTFRIENVIPENASVNITIPYPILINDTKRYQQAFAKVDSLINNDVEQGFPGAVLVVVKDGKIIKNTAYGYARKYADGGELLTMPVSMSTDTLFDLASNTKMFATNFALMQLVSEGKLDVSKSINHYLPNYRGQGRELRTVKDLLTHNAGYSPQVNFFNRDNHLGSSFYSQNAKRTKNLLLTKVPFEVGRTTKRMYSDTDYMLLGMLIEKVTGMDLDKYVEYSIYYPLGLKSTVFNPLQKGFRQNQFAATEIHGNTRGHRIDFDNIRDEVLQGEVHDEKAYHSFAGVAGHAGLFSSAEELAVLTQVLLNGGGYGDKQLFSEKVLSQFIKPDDGNGTYGLGWRRANNGDRKWHFGPYASSAAYGHTGWTGTAVVIDPNHDLAIILLTNARHSDIAGDDKHYHFTGKQFETGKYGSVISLVYEAILEK